MMSTLPYITLDIRQFCAVSGLGQTLVRAMLADGRLQAVRIGRKKIMIVVESYHQYLAKQLKSGTPDYNGTKAALQARGVI